MKLYFFSSLYIYQQHTQGQFYVFIFVPSKMDKFPMHVQPPIQRKNSPAVKTACPQTAHLLPSTIPSLKYLESYINPPYALMKWCSIQRRDRFDV